MKNGCWSHLSFNKRVGQVNLHASRIEDRRLVNLGLGGS